MMIYYLVTARYRNVIEYYLDTWGSAFRERLEIVPYENLSDLKSASAGSYIFSDLERLNTAQCRMATQFWEQLVASGMPVRLLNHPQRTMRRYQLLQTLHEHGMNDFRAYRLTEAVGSYRFPVFLRGENDHAGSLTGLLRTQRDLNDAILKLFREEAKLETILVVEYCDTSDAQGEFRKYSAFIVGDEIIPRHVIFSRNWVLKFPDLLEERRLDEERAYLKDNPHADWLRTVFALARVTYGRIDYGICNGRPQVWEINTNPIVMFPPNHYHASHLPAQDWFAGRIRLALEALDTDTGRAGIPLEWHMPNGPSRPCARRPAVWRWCSRTTKRVLNRLATRSPALVVGIILTVLRRRASLRRQLGPE
jgi:hypothetical protein